MEKYTTKPFTEALRPILQERYADKLGMFNIGALTRYVAEECDLSSEYVRLMMKEQRPLRLPDVVEAVARFLQIDPQYFIEYRNWWVKSMMERYPCLSERVYDLTRTLIDSLGPSLESK